MDERERERLIYLELIKICLSTENFNIRYHARPSPTTEEEIDDVKKKKLVQQRGTLDRPGPSICPVNIDCVV